MSREELLALAERAEKATGGDRELDALIRCAVFAPPGSWVKQSQFNGAWCIYDGKCQNGAPRLWEPFNISAHQRAGAFTASLDAAMSLVPEPHKWSITAGHSGDRWQAWVWSLDRGPNWHEAATPTLALTAASLRARAAEQGDGL